jgi:hypothetical protein
VGLRAGLFVLLLAAVTAIAAPAFVDGGDRCATSAPCVADGGERHVPCITDARCGGTAAGAAGAVALLAVFAIGPAIPALLDRSHVESPRMVSPPLLLVQRLLRPPQPALPS